MQQKHPILSRRGSAGDLFAQGPRSVEVAGKKNSFRAVLASSGGSSRRGRGLAVGRCRLVAGHQLEMNGSNLGQKSFEEQWPEVHRVVLDLLYQRAVSKTDWQVMFQTVYYLHSWLDDGDDMIRKALLEDVKVYVKECAQRVNADTKDKDLLPAYIREWTRYFKQTHILPMPFRSLEGTRDGAAHNAIPPLPTTPRDISVKGTMLRVWNRYVFAPIQLRLLNEAMNLIDAERKGFTVDPQLIVGVRESFVSLNASENDPLECYRNEYESCYLNRTVLWYKLAASYFLDHNGVRNYMAYADEKLQEEESRADRYLDQSSKQKLVAACVKVLVAEFEEQLLSECEKLVKSEDVERLRMLYRLIKRTPTGINTVLKCVDAHIRERGTQTMLNNASSITTDPERFVFQLLDMFDGFSSLIREGFYDDARVLTARDQAFCEVVNDATIFKLEFPHVRKGKATAESKCPELLANYCDLLLRKTPLSKRLSGEEIDARLDNVMLVLKYVQNKDIFMRYHKAHLARRLILDMSADQDKEETVVARLRENGMPSDHVNKLFRMLADVELNKDLNQAFRKYLWETSSPLGSQINDLVSIKILNTAAWSQGPHQTDCVKITIPRQLEEYLPVVEDFYKRNHSGRKLQWLHHWSNGTVIFNSDAGRYEIQLTTFQLTVLFCWLDKPDEGLSFETIRLATELPDSELTRTLLSLCPMPPKADSQLLKCAGGPSALNALSDSTIFYLNTQFVPEKNGKPLRGRRVNLIGRLQLGLDAAASSEHEDIVALRALRVQEAIVKVLKMRKQMTAWQLHAELVEQLRHMFLPSRQLMKEQLEWLMENKHIERSTLDINTFIYCN
ncbi:unnamed protein product, partial [Mesorhabditis spiculigera]